MPLSLDLRLGVHPKELWPLFYKYLKVCGCPNLSPAIPCPLPLKKDETERMEEDTIQTLDRS